METKEITQEQQTRLAEYLEGIENAEKDFQECKADLIGAILENNISKAPDLFAQYQMYLITIALLKHIRTGEEPNY